MIPMTKSIFLCDDAVEDPVSKKVSVLSIFNAIKDADEEATVNVFACWRAGHGRTRTCVTLYRAGPTDWELVGQTSEHVLDFQNPLETIYSLYRLPSLRWLPGTYLFELHCEDEFVDDQILIVE